MVKIVSLVFSHIHLCLNWVVDFDMMTKFFFHFILYIVST